MQTISVVGPKGGCGKTTTAISLAGVLAGQGSRTLLVDVDPQGHCAAGLAIPSRSVEFTSADAMNSLARGSSTPGEFAWHISRDLSLIPGGSALERFGVNRRGVEDPDAEWLLEALTRRMWDTFDVCVIDAPAYEGTLRRAAINAASVIVIPVETSYYSLMGVTSLMERIAQQSERRTRPPKVAVLPTCFDGSGIATDLLEQLRAKWGVFVSPYPVRMDLSVREAASFGQPVSAYNADSPAARDYSSFASWLGLRMEEGDRDLVLNPQVAALARFIREGDAAPGRGAEAGAASSVPVASEPAGRSPETMVSSRLDDVTRRASAARRAAERAREA